MGRNHPADHAVSNSKPEIPMNAFLQHLSRGHAGPGTGASMSFADGEDSSQESTACRVISDAMFRALPSTSVTHRGRDRVERLVNEVIAAFVQGELRPGDPFPEPC